MLEKAIKRLISKEESAYRHVVELKNAGKDFWSMSCNYRYQLDGMCDIILYLFGEDAFEQANQIKDNYMDKVFKLMD